MVASNVPLRGLRGLRGLPGSQASGPVQPDLLSVRSMACRAAVRRPRELPGVLQLALAVERAAAMLGIGRTLMYRRCATGKIHSFKAESRRIVPLFAVEQYIAERVATTSRKTA
jgi:hypothetical protein